MSIMEKIFGATPAPAAPQVQSQQEIQNAGVNGGGNPLPGTATGQGTDNNGVVPLTPPESPLAKFKDIWNTPQTKPEDQRIFGEVNSENVFSSAKKVDFTKALTPEIAEKLQAGGEDAIKATVQLMNSFAQGAYGQSAKTTIDLVETALAKQQTKFEAMLEKQFDNLSARQSIVESNPILNDPAVIPLRDALVTSFKQKFPHATPTEIKQQVIDYFGTLGTVFGSKPPTQSTPGTRRKSTEIDWDDWAR